MKSVPKKASNLFEDSDEEEDDFFSIKPKSAVTKKAVDQPIIETKAVGEPKYEVREESPKIDTESKKNKSLFGKRDPVIQRESDVRTDTKNLLEKDELKTEHKPKEPTYSEPVKNDVNETKSVNTPKKLENTLFRCSDDENDFILPSTAKSIVETKVETPKVAERPKVAKKPRDLNIVKAIVPDSTQVISEDKPDEKPQKSQDIFSPPTDLSFESVSIPPEDNSSELFSPLSDPFFTPSDLTPNTTTTATPVTPIYRSFIDDLPPDDDFSGSYDTNEFDTGYPPDDNENFEQSTISTAMDPFLFNDEPPELINDDIPIPTPVTVVKEVKVVSDTMEITKAKDSSPESFKNKFKMFETVQDTSKSPPKMEKQPVKLAPKKLNVNLNINVSALLPGAKRPSPKINDIEPLKEPEKQDNTQVTQSVEIFVTKTPEKVLEPINLTPEKSPTNETTENQSNLLVSLNKNRIRAPTTRKPSTRKARVQSYHESTQKDTVSEPAGTKGKITL